MTDNQLATLSTLVWLVLTTIVFVELASWSAGGSWTIVPALVHGVRGWIGRGQVPDLPAFAISTRPAVDPVVEIEELDSELKRSYRPTETPRGGRSSSSARPFSSVTQRRVVPGQSARAARASSA
jgi:hypothetical protein